MTRPTIDYNSNSPHYRENWVQIAEDFHASGKPIAWSDNYGGFWLVASHAAVNQIGSDWETFTSVNDLSGTENGGQGIVIPRSTYRLFLGESDPPLHTDRRRIEAPFFTPRSVRQWGPVAHGYLNEAVDALDGRGSGDLVDDVIIPTTARTTLHVLGYDPDDWRDAAYSAHAAVFLMPDDPGYPRDEQARLRQRFRDIILERRTNPTGDLITALAQGTVQGEPLSLDEAESMLNILVFGGFDTTTALVAHALIWLDDKPELKERLRDHAALRKNAVEEFLRVVTPATNIARTAVKDTEILGQKIAKGERVWMWLAGANRDPLVFESPNEIRLDRENARDHVAFSTGNHRCLGSPLAKVEAEAMLETILRRLPDMRIDHEGIKKYPRLGSINGFSAVPFRLDATAA
ncbi:cytochrome P450 [Arthrobacter sp. W4I7]|uniref:cytochrome P450 n=1 Tax=Arthrobacter sp. W4I7 TaxID=3042296 RepID=UPI002785A121|nr:cytochrome P450 [Arthrobacter sp. W4I7]MDQ0691430.1 cytochrome P450 [Arthrobacter sp. W4I7]